MRTKFVKPMLMSLLISSSTLAFALEDSESEYVIPDAEIAEPSWRIVPDEFSSQRADSWRFTLGLGYMLASSDAEFKNATYSDPFLSVPGSAEFGYDRTYAIILEGRYLPRQSFGFIGGLNYEGERNFNGGRINGGGNATLLASSDNSSSVQFTTFYASGVYRWDSFYLPFGLNYTVPRFTHAAGYTGVVSEDNAVGGQVGLGLLFTDDFAVEIYDWITAMGLKMTDPFGTSNFGRGTFTSLLMVGKYSL